MRDIRRIDTVMTLIGAYWKNYPDLRFFQMLTLLQTHIADTATDLFYLEDEVLISKLQQLCEDDASRMTGGEENVR